MTVRMRWPTDDELDRQLRAAWIEAFGAAEFTATWDPTRGLFTFLTELGLPPDLARSFDVAWWGGGDDITIVFNGRYQVLQPGHSFTIRPSRAADIGLLVGWEPDR